MREVVFIMLCYGMELGLALMLSSAALALVVLWLRRNHWRVGLKIGFGVTAYVAIVCVWVSSDVREILPYCFEFFPYFVTGLVPLVLWPFLIAWIAVSATLDPIANRAAMARRQGITFVRHAPRRRTIAWIPGWFLVVVIYVVFHKTWTCSIWPMLPWYFLYSPPWQPTIWSHVNDVGMSLRAMDHTVNCLFIVYVLVNVWRELVERRDDSTARFVPYVIALVLLVEKQFVIPPF